MWKTVIGSYQINQKGEMRNFTSGRLLKPKKTKNGYLQYGVSVDGKYMDISAHRSVAKFFVENPLDKPLVNHKDGNKINNDYTNLEWVTPEENMQHAVKTGLLVNTHRNKKVCQLDKSGNVLNVFPSLVSAAKYVGGRSSNISQCCSGNRLTHKGYRWELLSSESPKP